MISGAESAARAVARSVSGRPDKSSKTFRNLSAEALRLVGELAIALLIGEAGGSGEALEVSFNLRYTAQVGDKCADGACVALMVGGRGVGVSVLGGHVVCHAPFHLLELGVDRFVETTDEGPPGFERCRGCGSRSAAPLFRWWAPGGGPSLRPVPGGGGFSTRPPGWTFPRARRAPRACGPAVVAGTTGDTLDRDAVPFSDAGERQRAGNVQATDLLPVGLIRAGHAEHRNVGRGSVAAQTVRAAEPRGTV